MKTMETVKPLLIAKEQIPELSFYEHDVLQSESEKTERLIKLQKGMILGNSPEHVKVMIVFKSLQGFFRVETTIWAVDETNAQLKANIFIPIRAIVDVLI
jgi:hypothetical protein